MKEIRLCDNGNLYEVADLCEEYNLGIEVQSFSNIPKINELIPYMLKEHKEILNNISCGKSLHGPFKSYELGHDDLDIVKIIKKRFQTAYDVAKELNCTEIVIHNSYKPGTYIESKYVGRVIEFLEEFLEDKDDSIMLCLENQFELYPDMLRDIVDGVDDPRVKICLDIGHINANTDTTIEEWITNLGERIAYLHLHNNHGKQNVKGYNNDEHLGLNTGTIEMGEVLNLLEDHCPNAIWNIESGTIYLEESIEFLQSKGFILL